MIIKLLYVFPESGVVIRFLHETKFYLSFVLRTHKSIIIFEGLQYFREKIFFWSSHYFEILMHFQNSHQKVFLCFKDTILVHFLILITKNALIRTLIKILRSEKFFREFNIFFDSPQNFLISLISTKSTNLRFSSHNLFSKRAILNFSNTIFMIKV